MILTIPCIISGIIVVVVGVIIGKKMYKLWKNRKKRPQGLNIPDIALRLTSLDYNPNLTLTNYIKDLTDSAVHASCAASKSVGERHYEPEIISSNLSESTIEDNYEIIGHTHNEWVDNTEILSC